tara:strand:+ start:482 stop:676 length:195 start_codon:yes stop_codon:yes gene_type:complete
MVFEGVSEVFPRMTALAERSASTGRCRRFRCALSSAPSSLLSSGEETGVTTGTVYGIVMRRGAA